jgi:hypothetical protein
LNAAIANGEDAVQTLINEYDARTKLAQDKYKADINNSDAALVAELKADSELATKIMTKLLELLKIYTD